MARNVEIKAAIDSVDTVEPCVAALADAGPTLICQHDVFFACPAGRLKLRDFGDGHGELIAYERADATSPATSSYSRSPTSDPDGLRNTLAMSLGTTGEIRKTRVLYFVGRTRIHLDRVAGLGDFLELEVVLGADEPTSAGQIEAETIMTRLGMCPSQRRAPAYVDLLAARKDSAD